MLTGKASQKRLGILGRVSEDATPLSENAELLRDQIRQLQPNLTALNPLVSPNPFSIQYSLLYPLAVLYIAHQTPACRYSGRP